MKLNFGYGTIRADIRIICSIISMAAKVSWLRDHRAVSGGCENIVAFRLGRAGGAQGAPLKDRSVR